MVPLQGIVGLVQFEEDVMEDRLPHGDYLLKYIFFKGGGPRSYPRTKSIQGVMEMDGRRYLAIGGSGYDLSHDLHQANPPEVGAFPLGIITTVCQLHVSAISPTLKSAFMMATTLSQFPGLGLTSRFAARSHNLRCSAPIIEGPLAKCSRIRITASAISSSPGIASSTGKGATSM